MKKVFIILLTLLTLLFLISCEITIPLNKSSETISDYFPKKVGQSITYKDSSTETYSTETLSYAENDRLQIDCTNTQNKYSFLYLLSEEGVNISNVTPLDSDENFKKLIDDPLDNPNVLFMLECKEGSSYETDYKGHSLVYKVENLNKFLIIDKKLYKCIVISERIDNTDLIIYTYYGKNTGKLKVQTVMLFNGSEKIAHELTAYSIDNR